MSRSEQKEDAAELCIQKSFCPEQQDSALGRRFLLAQLLLCHRASLARMIQAAAAVGVETRYTPAVSCPKKRPVPPSSSSARGWSRHRAGT